MKKTTENNLVLNSIGQRVTQLGGFRLIAYLTSCIQQAVMEQMAGLLR